MGKQSKPSNGPTLPTYSYTKYGVRHGALYLPTTELANAAIRRHFPPAQPPPTIGFDIEWRPVFRKGQPENNVALVQLSSADAVLLIQLTSMAIFPNELMRLLADPRVAKAGVGIGNDVKKVFRDCNVGPIRNVVELALLARSVDNENWKGRYKDPIGLARLVEFYERKCLPKGRITRSNWEARPLSAMQIEYAASDAHAGFLLHQRLHSMLMNSSPAPPEGVIARPKRAYFSFDLHGGELFQCTPYPSACALHYPDLLSDSDSTLGSPSCTCSSWSDTGLFNSNYATLLPWGPINPDYDPGPPPPPKVPKPDRSLKKTDEGFVYDPSQHGSTASSSMGTTSSIDAGYSPSRYQGPSNPLGTRQRGGRQQPYNRSSGRGPYIPPNQAPNPQDYYY